jgi:hypothetical protein
MNRRGQTVSRKLIPALLLTGVFGVGANVGAFIDRKLERFNLGERVKEEVLLELTSDACGEPPSFTLEPVDIRKIPDCADMVKGSDVSTAFKATVYVNKIEVAGCNYVCAATDRATIFAPCTSAPTLSL